MSSEAGNNGNINIAKDAVFGQSEEMPIGSLPVKGYDFSNGLDYHELLKSYRQTGLQATNFALAVEEINKMLQKRGDYFIPEAADLYEEDEFIKRKSNCTIFLGYTSNMVSCGVRETILFLVKNKLVDCIVTTAGGIEEDFIKCQNPSYIGNFNFPGQDLRAKGLNRIGNMIVPNKNYCEFENWLNPILDAMLEEQKSTNFIWSPSKIIDRLGQEINDATSIYYWAAKNKIPVFSPAITDGSIGDIIFFHSCKNSDQGLIVDIAQDIKRINKLALKASYSGMVLVGGGIIKHHIANANLMRNGADYSVYLNTSCEYEGSDSGANPDEAVSWGKIKATATPVKIYAEASLIFPLLVAETFYKYYEKHILK